MTKGKSKKRTKKAKSTKKTKKIQRTKEGWIIEDGITKLPPGEAFGARDLQSWSSNRRGGGYGTP